MPTVPRFHYCCMITFGDSFPNVICWLALTSVVYPQWLVLYLLEMTKLRYSKFLRIWFIVFTSLFVLHFRGFFDAPVVVLFTVYTDMWCAHCYTAMGCARCCGSSAWSYSIFPSVKGNLYLFILLWWIG